MRSKLVPLSQIADIVGGYAFKSEDLKQEGFPVVKIANIEPPRVNLAACERISPDKVHDLDRFTLKDRDILMAMTGATTGKVGRFRSNALAYLNQRVAKISSKAGPRYDDFIYALVSQPGFDEQVINNASGSAQPNVSADGIGRIPVPDLSPEEQFEIGQIAAALDDKIELNRRMNETLEAIARAIFKSWFVDFDPVRAKASGEPPESICRRLGLTPELLALFPDKFQDSELGEIPEGWKIGTLDSYAQLNPESWTKANLPVAVEYVDLANTKWGKIEATQSFAWKSAPSRAQRVLRPGDTIVGTVRPGNGSFALIGDDGLTGSTGFAVLRPKKPTYETYIYLWVTRKENIDRLAHLADGAAYPAVNPEVVQGTPCLVLCDKLIDQFGVLSKSLLTRTVANERESRTLSIVRDTLLPKLISGALRVPEAIA
jgi:type I restriction enzyme S subunit